MQPSFSGNILKSMILNELHVNLNILAITAYFNIILSKYKSKNVTVSF
jgi:hypothetical protein